MPRWELPTLEDELAWAARDLASAEALRDSLPAGSRDGVILQELIGRLDDQIRNLISSTGVVISYPRAAFGPHDASEWDDEAQATG